MSLVDIIAIRGAGDIPGEDIIDPLIFNTQMALQRGRNEIDSNSRIRPTTIDVIYRPGLRSGQTVRVLDSAVGSVWYGKVTSVSLSLVGADLQATLQVERAA